MNGLLLFHLNLDFSSIELRQHRLVIKNCYYPLLNLVRSTNTNISIELSGRTLERINAIDQYFIKDLKTLINDGKVEIVGSSYVQSIGPLFPNDLNALNLKEGQNTYSKILGVEPKIALISEMALSQSLIDIYLEAGFKTIIMDIDNISESSNISKNNLYKYGDIQSSYSTMKIKIIWSDSIMFQKFQRYIHGDLSLNDYLSFIKKIISKKINLYLPIYSNDAEIFNFRPGRFDQEAKIECDEWSKIVDLIEVLKSQLNLTFKNPSYLSNIKKFKLDKKVVTLKTLNQISSAKYPVPVKKQKKYNINRWAVTGRDDQFLNTMSYRILNAMNQNLIPQNNKNIRFLLKNSASDLRTHITHSRWESHMKELNFFLKKYKIFPKTKIVNKAKYSKLDRDLTFSLFSMKTEEEKYLKIKNSFLNLKLNLKKGLSIESLGFKDHKFKPYLQSFKNDFYDSIEFGADFFSGNVLLEIPSKMKRFTDLSSSQVYYQINSESINLLIEIPSPFFTLQKRIDISLISQKVSIGYIFKKIKPFIGILRVGNFLFSAKPLKKTMKIQTKIGGNNFECFEFGETSFDHTEAASSFVSSSRGLPSTDGIIEISDIHDRGIKFIYNNHDSFAMPMIKYNRMLPNSFLRLIFSLREVDDTSKASKHVQPMFIEISPISKGG